MMIILLEITTKHIYFLRQIYTLWNERIQDIVQTPQMTILTFSALTILGFMTLWRLKQFSASIIALRWSIQQKRLCQGIVLPYNQYPVPQVIVLIPALREQPVLARVLKTLSCYEYPRSHFLVIIVTTEKEIAQKKEKRSTIRLLVDAFNRGCSTKKFARLAEGVFSRSQLETVRTLLQQVPCSQQVSTLEAWYDRLPTTPDLAKQLASEFNTTCKAKTFFHIHYPYEYGTKASQLNYAISQLTTLMPSQYDDENTYIAVCDADAMPDTRTGRSLLYLTGQAHAEKKPLPALLQQVPVPVLGIKHTGKGLEGALLRSQALLHIRRSLGIEVFKLLYRQWLFRQQIFRPIKALARPMIYGIGAGLYIKFSTLKQIGLFPEPVDDLGVGYRISMLDLEASPLPYFCYVEPYVTLRQLILAYSFVFLGGLQVGKECQRVAKHPSPLNKFEQAVLIAKEWLDSLSWIFGIPLVTYAMITTVLGLGLLGAVLVTISVIIQYPLSSYFLLKFLKWLDVPTLEEEYNLYDKTPIQDVLMLITTPLQPFLLWLSPVYYLINSSILRLKGKHLVFGKTER